MYINDTKVFPVDFAIRGFLEDTAINQTFVQKWQWKINFESSFVTFIQGKVTGLLDYLPPVLQILTFPVFSRGSVASQSYVKYTVLQL